jgi:hypothetical protein
MSCQLFAVGRGRGARTSTAASDQAVLAAAAHLTGRDRRLARAVGEHRVLTTGQLAALGFASVITARHRLAVLTGLAVLRRVPAAPRGRVGALALPARPGRRRAARRRRPRR